MIYRQGRNYENLNKMIYRGTGKFDTPPNASKELPKSFYQQDKAKGKKKSEVPDI